MLEQPLNKVGDYSENPPEIKKQWSAAKLRGQAHECTVRLPEALGALWLHCFPR